MKIISPYYEFISEPDGAQILKNIERCGRICYKSEDKITEDSAERFAAMILKSGHESVLEHEKISVRIICDRGVSHEIVRHRIASYSQESTRYCNYSKDKFGNELTFIRPPFWQEGDERMKLWEIAMEQAEKSYFALLAAGAKPEEARDVLPNSLKTEIAVTMDIREWRHFFKLRTNQRAHPQIRELTVPMLKDFRERVPVLFGDLEAKG
ncbi:MAG: FAD-dependent thymidylate synthase [Ruminococcus sp.]|nr:FAD-dependent thymidylate synthase [Ruminococcus sp.]